MPEIANDRPFVLMANLLIADQHGDYEKAAESQRQLANLGWYVSRKPPDEPKPARRKKSNVNA